MLGSLACQASERIKDKKPIIGYAALLVSIASMLLGSPSGFDSFRLCLSVICFAISLPAVFATTKSIAVLNFLGDLSYPLYLVQILVFVLVGHGIMEMVPYRSRRTIGIYIAAVVPLLMLRRRSDMPLSSGKADRVGNEIGYLNDPV
jgi:peptidoglycan/LPS O-acetylase OafA/YrhL